MVEAAGQSGNEVGLVMESSEQQGGEDVKEEVERQGAENGGVAALRQEAVEGVAQLPDQVGVVAFEGQFGVVFRRQIRNGIVAYFG